MNQEGRQHTWQIKLVLVELPSLTLLPQTDNIEFPVDLWIFHGLKSTYARAHAHAHCHWVEMKRKCKLWIIITINDSSFNGFGLFMQTFKSINDVLTQWLQFLTDNFMRNLKPFEILCRHLSISLKILIQKSKVGFY